MMIDNFENQITQLKSFKYNKCRIVKNFQKLKQDLFNVIRLFETFQNYQMNSVKQKY